MKGKQIEVELSNFNQENQFFHFEDQYDFII